MHQINTQITKSNQISHLKNRAKIFKTQKKITVKFGKEKNKTPKS